jgi:hypothetical protein
MTTKQIEAKQMKETLVFETAKKIRELLDAARKEYGASEWDDNGKEQETLDLVTEEA